MGQDPPNTVGSAGSALRVCEPRLGADPVATQPRTRTDNDRPAKAGESLHTHHHPTWLIGVLTRAVTRRISQAAPAGLARR
jgi:hypothetical protein